MVVKMFPFDFFEIGFMRAFYFVASRASLVDIFII